MKVGDLVKDKNVPALGFGIITSPEVGGWWVYWQAADKWGFHNQTNLEVIACK